MKSIKTSVWIRVIAALLSVLLLGGALAVSISSISGAREAIAQAEALSKIAYSAEVAHFNWAANLSDCIYSGTDFTGSVDDHGCVLGKWIYGDAGTTDSQVLALMQQIKPLHQSIHSSASQVLSLQKTDENAAQTYYHEVTQADIATLVGLLNQVVDRADTLNQTSNETMQRDIRSLLLVSVVCVVLCLICLLSLIQYVMRQVVHPVLLIARESANLSRGELRFHVNVSGQNELAQLAGTLEQSVSSISEYVVDIDHAMEQLATGDFNVRFHHQFLGDFEQIQRSVKSFATRMSEVLHQIETAAVEVSNGAGHIATGSQAMSQGATMQAASVEELASSMSDISRQVEDSAKHALSASRISQETADELETGKQQMSQMVQAMDRITHASEEIGKILATIENIAFQTNILALNAAVEAARAGTAGKGFSVVADEVRNLAGKSAAASQSTAVLIENTISAVREGSEIAMSTSSSLDKVVDSAARSVSLIQQISQATQTQSEALAQATTGIDQISSVVQTNSATAQESAAASQELFHQSKRLNDLVKRFQLLPEQFAPFNEQEVEV